MHAHHHPYTALLTHLKAHLPQSGPLLRRIQHQVTHPSPTAQVLASFSPDSEPETGTGTESPWLAAYADVHRGLDTQVWVFSTLETKAISNPKSKSKSASDSASAPTPEATHHDINGAISTQEKETTKFQLLSLFTHVRTKLVPPYIAWLSSQPPAPVPDPKKARDEGVKKIPPHPKTSVLLGSVHKTVVELICELASETLPTKPSSGPGTGTTGTGPSEIQSSRPGVRIHRGQNVFYAKYCFPSSSFNDDAADDDDDNSKGPEKGSLLGKGSGYTFTDSTGVSGIQEKHLDLVKNRTNIPRSKQALMAMGGVALYYRPGGDGDGSPASSRPVSTAPGTGAGAGTGVGVDGEEEGEMPIGWAFLGFDGSLCTLHVEPEHRGKGLGGVVGKEVMKRGVDVFEPSAHNNHDGPGEEWFFADVSVDNVASRRVMEKMGGEVGWYVAWMVVEADI